MSDDLISVGAMMLRLYRQYEPAYDALVKRYFTPPSCGRGCAACCELATIITWPEALAIAEDLVARGQVEQFAPGLAEQARRASFEGVDGMSYFLRRIPCAFLEADKSCGVYGARPTCCRYHTVFSPREACADRDDTGGTIAVDSADVLNVVLWPVLEQLEKEGMGRGAYICAPIPVFVLAALRELGQRVEATITPEEWFTEYGQHFFEYHRAHNGKRREIVDAQGAGGR